MTATLLRRIKDRMYSLAPSGDDYYAFWADGRAGLYIDGTFVSYRPGGSGGGPAIPEAPSLIHTDSEALVGPGSIAYRVDSTNLQVWDVEAEVTYDYAVPAGYVTTPPIYAAGYLWWVEREAVQHGPAPYKTWARLRKARTDFTSVATVITYEISIMGIGFSVNWDAAGPPKIALTAAGAILQAYWSDNINGEVAGWVNVRLERDGSGGTDSQNPEVSIGGWTISILPPTSGSTAFSADSIGILGADLADAADAAPAAIWSPAEDWNLSTTAVTASVSADGSEGGLHNIGELVRGPTATGTPTNRFTIGPSPTDDWPEYFFIKG